MRRERVRRRDVGHEPRRRRRRRRRFRAGARARAATLGAAHVAVAGRPARRAAGACKRAGADELARAAQGQRRARRSLRRRGRGGGSIRRRASTHEHRRGRRARPDGAPSSRAGWTIQLNDPARIAERAGITVVADFRRRDVAAGGQGAPLVPAFHARCSRATTRTRAVLNLGGIANLTLLAPGGPVRGFDTGPGNVAARPWHARHRGGAFDANGRWAAQRPRRRRAARRAAGRAVLRAPPPKSTGRDLFDLRWLDARLARRAATVAAADVQATLRRADGAHRSPKRCARDAGARGGAGSAAAARTTRR